jgi:hypothetical protein
MVHVRAAETLQRVHGRGTCFTVAPVTVDEVDQALALPSKYRAPGQEN